jgi:pyruvate/2-oxoglutarate dehydrogenase complex dihydrolipoamide dehydrogenase (E3) component
VSGKCRDSVSVVVEQNGIEKVLKGSHVLVATGRNPNTEGLGLELTGVELTDRGYIKVNERLQTTARPASGRSARSQVARSSRTSASTISA